MQRFKRHLFETTSPVEMIESCIRLNRPASWPSCADGKGKFVYGADGTLTPAALYRLTSVVNATRYPGEKLANYRIWLASVRHMSDAAKREGWRLP